MMRRIPVAAFLCVVFLAGPALADSMAERFAEANGLYFKKRYAKAADIYGDLISRYKLNDAVLYYNLANAHYQQKNLGLAVLNYKRARRAQPSEGLESKIKDNLERTTEALIDRHRRDVARSVTVLDETHGAAYSIFHLMSADVIAWVFAGLWCLFFVALILRKKALWVTVSVPVLAAAVLLIGNMVTASTVERAIVVKDNVQMRDGRHKNAPMADIPEGLEVRVLDTTDPKETRIRLSNGKEGWVPAEAVETI